MEQNQGNPSTEPNQPSDNNEAQSQVFGSSEEFFSQLESEVNGAIDDSAIATGSTPMNEPGNESPVTAGPQQVTPQMQQGNSNSIDWEKRYKDSSREAQRLNQKVNELSKFEPLLNVMRKDKGLVTHVKDYLQSGGKPGASIQEKLKLDEDFRYDEQDAMDDPESDSAKVFNAKVEETVNSKIGDMNRTNQKIQQNKVAQANAVRQLRAFQKKHKLPPEQVKDIMEYAVKRKLSIDEAYLIKNKDQVDANVANNTRKDVMQQMQNARSIPQSVSHSNSAQVEKNPTDDVFDALLGSDEADNLFG